MKKLLLFICAIVFLFGMGGVANATWYEFDFNDLQKFATAEEIENYMENTVPPPGNVELSDTTTAGGDFGSNYLRSGSDGAIEIAFTERQILEIYFDWGSRLKFISETGETKGFYAYADGSDTPFYSYIFSDDEWAASDTGVYINFIDLGIAPVSSLKFANSPANGYITLDNLRIENDDGRDSAPVPEPATMLLLGSGLIGLAGIGRKKLIRSKG
jgi:hypothetical protein